MTKATTAEGDTVRRSLNWALARRGTLEVWTDALRFKDWQIPYAQIDEAVLHSIWQGLLPGFVLVVKSKGTIYQFGLNYGKFWKGELPFAVDRASGQMGCSWGSILLRVLLVAAALYYLLSR
ncbi:MAG: hypothetical protein U0836_11605 [Pirellulales bacterium]